MGQSIQEWAKYICGKQPLNNLIKLFKGCLPQIYLIHSQILCPKCLFFCNENGNANFFIWCILKTVNQKIKRQNNIIREYRAGFVE